MLKAFSDISQALEARRAESLYRQRVRLDGAQQVRAQIDGRPMLSFCSNDYLGLANHSAISRRLTEAAQVYGTGAGASHLVNGHHAEHEALEAELADFTGREAALVFSTGYMANLGVISALMGRSDTVVQDKLNHASLIDGTLLSQARLLRYRHNDLDHLENRLQQANGKCLVVTDGVFSMDGDCAPLRAMSDLCQRYGAWLMVDDAHGLGVLGEQGRGLVNQCGLSASEVPLLIGTLGKAFGTSGAFVAGSRDAIDYILQHARSYIYTTAAPPAVAAATREALVQVQQADDRRAHLNNLIERFREGISALPFDLMPSQTPIQPVLVGSNDAAMALSQGLRERGLLVTAIRPPTVPAGEARLRITLSADHTEDDVDHLLTTLEALA